ncbi:MAG: type II toxin-antitoxin system RatA family toxin [Planktomarina sp.]
MPTHKETKILPYTAQQMYDLVADVASYPQFLPWAAAARIRQTVDHGDHIQMDADLMIGFKGFREKFGSRVLLWPQTRHIDTEYIDGPFKFMKSTWDFEDTDNGVAVTFFVDFEFKNAILQGVIGLVFHEAMQRIVKAFEARAKALYG